MTFRNDSAPSHSLVAPCEFLCEFALEFFLLLEFDIADSRHVDFFHEFRVFVSAFDLFLFALEFNDGFHFESFVLFKNLIQHGGFSNHAGNRFVVVDNDFRFRIQLAHADFFVVLLRVLLEFIESNRLIELSLFRENLLASL